MVTNCCGASDLHREGNRRLYAAAKRGAGAGDHAELTANLRTHQDLRFALTAVLYWRLIFSLVRRI